MTELAEMVSTREAADRLGVSERTVQRMADAGELRAIRVRPVSPRRFREAEVEELRRRIYEEAVA